MEPRKPRKVNKPLGDDELFGDSGDIFSDIPSKPKDKKKKKSATTAPVKDDIFADQSAAGKLWFFLNLFYFGEFVEYRKWFDGYPLSKKCLLSNKRLLYNIKFS